MRYRIGENTENLDNLGKPVGDELVSFSAVLGLLMGIIFIFGGLRGKQFWLIFWGSGLVISSILYLAADLLGYL